MVEECARRALLHARCARDDEEGNLLGPGVGDRICELQPTDAVGAGRDPESLQPSEAIGCEPGALLICGDENGETQFIKLAEKSQGVIANDPKSEFDLEFPKAAHQMLRDRRVFVAQRSGPS